MANDIGPEQQPLQSCQGINVFRDAFDEVVAQVQLPQISQGEEFLRNARQLIALDAQPFEGLEFSNPRGQAVQLVFVKDQFLQPTKPPKPVVDVFPFLFGQVQSPYAFGPHQGLIEVGPNPRRIPR